MDEYEPDEVDLQLLTLLQDDARHTAVELAEAVGVSDNTVHNRMARMEEVGVIGRYSTRVDYDQLGMRLHFLFVCTTRISERGRVAEEALALPSVTEVTELMTGQRNLHIKAIGREDEHITRVAEQVDQLDVEINDEVLIREEHVKSIDFVEVEGFLDEVEVA